MAGSSPIIHRESVIPTLLSLVIRPAAVTLGRHVFVHRGVIPSDGLLRHEAVHVGQFAELGPVRFLGLYVADWLRAWWALRDGVAAYQAIRLAGGRALPGLQRDIQGPKRRVRPEVELYPGSDATSRGRNVAFGRR